jgi:hypothetical protein
MREEAHFCRTWFKGEWGDTAIYALLAASGAEPGRGLTAACALALAVAGWYRPGAVDLDLVRSPGGDAGNRPTGLTR